MSLVHFIPCSLASPSVHPLFFLSGNNQKNDVNKMDSKNQLAA